MGDICQLSLNEYSVLQVSWLTKSVESNYLFTGSLIMSYLSHFPGLESSYNSYPARIKTVKRP